MVMFGARSVVAEQVLFKRARAPRVYNALITSEQRLLPSQTDPIVTPVFRPFSLFSGYDGWPSVYAAPIPYLASASITNDIVQQSVDVSAATTVNADMDVETDDERRLPQPAVKNNRPVDSSVPDVPPPPLPVSVGGAKNKKKPVEYPPAPLGFAI